MRTTAKRHTRRLALLVATIAVPLVIAWPAAAAQPSSFSQYVNFTDYAPDTSAACGVPVYITLEGTFNTKLFYDRSGNLVRELDFAPGATLTFSSPATGKSFSYSANTIFHTYYPEGATIGSTATVVATGFQGSSAGPGSGPPTAGRALFEGTIVDVSPEGIPLVDIGEPSSVTGSNPDFSLAARCAALTGSRR